MKLSLHLVTAFGYIVTLSSPWNLVESAPAVDITEKIISSPLDTPTCNFTYVPGKSPLLSNSSSNGWSAYQPTVDGGRTADLNLCYTRCCEDEDCTLVFTSVDSETNSSVCMIVRCSDVQQCELHDNPSAAVYTPVRRSETFNGVNDSSNDLVNLANGETDNIGDAGLVSTTTRTETPNSTSPTTQGPDSTTTNSLITSTDSEDTDSTPSTSAEPNEKISVINSKIISSTEQPRPESNKEKASASTKSSFHDNKLEASSRKSVTLSAPQATFHGSGLSTTTTSLPDDDSKPHFWQLQWWYDGAIRKQRVSLFTMLTIGLVMTFVVAGLLMRICVRCCKTHRKTRRGYLYLSKLM